MFKKELLYKKVQNRTNKNIKLKKKVKKYV